VKAAEMFVKIFYDDHRPTPVPPLVMRNGPDNAGPLLFSYRLAKLNG